MFLLFRIPQVVDLDHELRRLTRILPLDHLKPALILLRAVHPSRTGVLTNLSADRYIRAGIRERKLVVKISSFQRCRRALERIEVPANTLFPVAKLAHSGLPGLECSVKTSLSGRG